jgi:hypothetical protein
MRPLLVVALFSASSLVLAACGRVIVDPSGGVNGGSGGSGGNSGSGGAAATTGGAGGEPSDGGEMCNTPPPPSPTLPDQPGCYVNTMGSGWVLIPCLCDLWLANTTPAPITAGIQLIVTPPEQIPTLTGPLDVEVAFDDPDASWFATWTKQPGNGEVFTVTSQGGTTTVRMGEGGFALAPVPIAACTTRKAVALVLGSTSATLTMKAILADGNGSAIATTDGTCSSPPLP